MQFYWKSSQANPIYREREGTKWLFEVNGDNLSNKCLYFSGLKVTIIIFKVVHRVPYILKSIIIQLEFNPISLSIIYFGSSKVPIISTFLKKYLLYIKQDHAAILCAYLSVDLSLHCEFL